MCQTATSASSGPTLAATPFPALVGTCTDVVRGAVTMGAERGDEYHVGCLTPPESSDRAYSAALIYVVDV
jgi:hypothetical protein